MSIHTVWDSVSTERTNAIIMKCLAFMRVILWLWAGGCAILLRGILFGMTILVDCKLVLLCWNNKMCLRWHWSACVLNESADEAQSYR